MDLDHRLAVGQRAGVDLDQAVERSAQLLQGIAVGAHGRSSRTNETPYEGGQATPEHHDLVPTTLHEHLFDRQGTRQGALGPQEIVQLSATRSSWLTARPSSRSPNTSSSTKCSHAKDTAVKSASPVLRVREAAPETT
jgi:hypothetical protein